MVRLKTRMISRILLALALVLTGCSTFTPAELAQIRQRNLRPELLAKMEHRRSLAPDDLIELKRAGVRDEQVVKHLNDVGVDYVATREDATLLRKARVSAWVIDSLLRRRSGSQDGRATILTATRAGITAIRGGRRSTATGRLATDMATAFRVVEDTTDTAGTAGHHRR